MDKMDESGIDTIYKSKSLEEIPWNRETPPDALVGLIKSGQIKPCKCIDLGCGAGNYSVYMASQGFEVTGVDLSPTAISLARKNAQKKGVSCTFLVADILGDMAEVRGTFDFAFDWGVIHHIFPEKRPGYVAHVHRILNPGGKYLSVCFSTKDPAFNSTEKYRKTSLGTVLYFSSEDELRELFSRCFKVINLKTIEERAKLGSHLFNYVFMEKGNNRL
jgi:cyclopropane fatty-acyl-phospholipid synthase-like methyltransferase